SIEGDEKMTDIITPANGLQKGGDGQFMFMQENQQNGQHTQEANRSTTTSSTNTLVSSGENTGLDADYNRMLDLMTAIWETVAARFAMNERNVRRAMQAVAMEDAEDEHFYDSSTTEEDVDVDDVDVAGGVVVVGGG